MNEEYTKSWDWRYKRKIRKNEGFVVDDSDAHIFGVEVFGGVCVYVCVCVCVCV